MFSWFRTSELQRRPLEKTVIHIAIHVAAVSQLAEQLGPGPKFLRLAKRSCRIGSFFALRGERSVPFARFDTIGPSGFLRHHLSYRKTPAVLRLAGAFRAQPVEGA
jgi:hypothetical protein